MAAQAQGNADEASNKELEPEAVLEKARRLEAPGPDQLIAPPGRGSSSKSAPMKIV